jgi:LysR family transcriptional regulator, carnitine catabolism transcriptional activator
MNPEDIDLKKLRAFQLVARHGSLRKAADKLGLTISAVSFSVRRLEESLGIKLLDRLPNKVALTATGKVFAAEAEALFASVDKAFGKFKSGERAPATLTLAICNGEMGSYLAPRICNFMEKNKEVQINVQIHSSKPALELLQAGEIDVCIGRFPALPDTLAQEFVVESGLTLACAPHHSLLKKKRLALEDIAEHTLFTLARHSLTRENIDRTFANAGVDVKSCVDAGNCRTAREFATRGVGVAIIHSLCAELDPSRKLRYVDLSRFFDKLAFYAVYRKKNVSPAILELIDELTETAQRAA